MHPIRHDTNYPDDTEGSACMKPHPPDRKHQFETREQFYRMKYVKQEVEHVSSRHRLNWIDSFGRFIRSGASGNRRLAVGSIR